MEMNNNMQQNKINDDELDQITGGRGIFDIFTTEFRGKAEKATTLEMHPEDENNHFAVSTLEMRANINDPQEAKKTRKLIKL